MSNYGKKETRPVRFHLIYLAAGQSVRFQGNKLLADFHGKPLYSIGLTKMAELAQRLENSGFQASANVVTSIQEIAEFCKTRQISYIENTGSGNTGIASSIKRGIELCEDCGYDKKSRVKIPDSGAHEAPGRAGDCDVFIPADQPFLNVDELFCFLSQFAAQEKGIGAMDCGGILRSPNVFSAGYREELKQLPGDTGGKAVLQRHKDDLFTYSVSEERMFFDIDTKTDYEKYLRFGSD